MLFTVQEIAEATGGRVTGIDSGEVAAVSTDSRTVKPGELFVALSGERFDGHDYVAAAASNGIKTFLVSCDWLKVHGAPAGTTCIEVTDTLRALGDLAAFHRSRFNLPVIGITGSNGKTTTKEMLSAILDVTGPGLKTKGNLNNLIGLPLMLLQLTASHTWAVLEMGMSELGEIDRLASIARPDVGIITNANPAHLSSMGSVENVARAKGELFLRLRRDGVAVYNAEDPLVRRLPSHEGVMRVSFGLQEGDIRASAITLMGNKGQTFRMHLKAVTTTVTLSAFGRHNVANALAAAAAAHSLGLSAETIKAGLEKFSPVEKRFTVEHTGALTLIDDSYNANPASMAAALVTLGEIRGVSRTVAILGEMLELGEESASAHRNVGRLAASSVDRLYLLGRMATEMAKGASEGGLEEDSILVMGSHEDILADLLTWVESGDCILVKGSRGMKMEQVAEGVRKFASSAEERRRG